MATRTFYCLGVLLLLLHFSRAVVDKYITIESLKQCENDIKTNIRFSDVFLDHRAMDDVRLSLNLDIDRDIKGPIMMEADILVKNAFSKNEFVHYMKRKEKDICPLLIDKKSLLAQIMAVLGFDQVCPLKRGNYSKKEDKFDLPEEWKAKLSEAYAWNTTIKFFKEKSKTNELCAVLVLKVNEKPRKNRGGFNFSKNSTKSEQPLEQKI